MVTSPPMAIVKASLIFPVLAIAGLLAGCGGRSTQIVEAPVAREWSVPPGDVLYRDDTAEIPWTREVIRDSISFSRHWAQATSALEAPPPTPVLDFSTDMVVFVGAGPSDRGDRIQVERMGFDREADRNDPDREIEVIYFVVRTTEEPNPFPGVSYPLEMVRVDRSDLLVSWRELPERD